MDKIKTLRLVIINLMAIIILKLVTNNVHAISANFKFVIDTVGIPKNNIYNEEINEDVYYTYNVFSYGAPTKFTLAQGQRWKDSKYGYWQKDAGRYKGSGIRGEYYLLGRSYSGAVIYNYYFPMDVIPTTTPDKWTFYSYPEALKSWSDTTKYKYTEQLEHMKNSKLMFNDITSRDKADNPKYIHEYNITANKIGLSKARLDVAATWKTNGMISTRRKINGIVYSQIYLVKPLAAGADVQTDIKVENNFVLKQNMKELIIPIEYTTSIINMTGFANKNHVKEIKAELYIDNKKIEEISGSKITSVGNKYMLVVTREHFPPNVNYSINISVDGYMHTEFVVDGLMRNIKNKTINLYVEPEPKVSISDKSIRILEKDSQNWVVRPLAQTSITSLANSIGFMEAGKYLALKLDLDIKQGKIEGLNISLDNNILSNIEQINVDDLDKSVFKVLIPKDVETTLYGMYSLRNKEGNYFSTNTNSIANRRSPPHKLKIQFVYKDVQYKEEMLFDTLDNYLLNINMMINKSILNYDEFNKRRSIQEWVKE